MLERCTTLLISVPMKKTIVLHTTVAKKEDARQIAKVLLDHELIGCAQISGPIESIYRWKGIIESGEEYKLSVKTTAELATETIELIQAHHPYDVPEIVGNSLDICLKEYNDWLVGEVKNVSV
ncbi:MAG: periplasmic divalent cation tolerance protein [Desulforhopalus sp.]